MADALHQSRLWRLLQWFAAAWSASGFRRFCAGISNCFLESGTHRIGVRYLSCPTAMTDGSRAAKHLRHLNNRLQNCGHSFMPALRSSLLYRIYRAIFNCGRKSKLTGWLFGGGLSAFFLLAVGLYGIVDYALRDVFAIPVVSSVWDDALLLLAVLWILYLRLRAPQPVIPRTTALDTPVFLFLGVGLALMILVSPFLSISISGYRATAEYILWFYILTRLIRSDRDLITLYLVLVSAAFLISLHGIYQYIVAAPIPSNWTDQAETSVRTRVYSIFGSPNIMGDFMVMFAPMTAALAYWFKDRRMKAFCWFATFCMCFSCLFTMSRGAWIAMVLAIFLFALLIDRRLIWLMVLAGVCSLFLPFVASRLGYLLSPQYAASTANGGRASRWEIALTYLKTNPVFGFGLGMFGGAVAMQNKIYPWISYFYVDNYYLKILVEMGYTGLAAFLLMMLGLLSTGLRAVYRSRKAAKEQSMYPLCAGMFSGLCGVLLHCFFENIFEEPYMMVYFWAIAAMIVYIGFLRKARPSL